MKLTNTAHFLAVAAAALALGAWSQPAATQCMGIADCQLVWSDEFDGTEVDTTKWTFQRGDGSEVGLPSGWGNNELQYYTDQNATVANGQLTITAKQESVQPGFSYTSARLRTLNKADFTYGRIEMRARMPVGRGLWPAFWMLPTDTRYGTWAASGEIDVMEYLGDDTNRVLGTIHYGEPWPNNRFSSADYVLDSGTFNEDFHVFAVEWEEGEIRWYVDDILYSTQNSWFSSGGSFPAPFDVDFHLLLNMAVGGNLPGSPDASTVFPQEYVIDYVRVYQKGTAPTLDGSASGTYVVEGLNDQGFFVTVGENASGSFMFVAWFTFDESGNPRWLVGIEFFEPGAASVTMTMQEISGLPFLEFSDNTASRNNFGTMTFTLQQCGTMQGDYDFGDAGTGAMTLSKLTNIEGRDC